MKVVMKDVYYISAIVVLVWYFGLVTLLGKDMRVEYPHSVEYVRTLESQLLKAAELMEQFKSRSDNIILLANEASSATLQAQKNLLECRTRGWREF